MELVNRGSEKNSTTHVLQDKISDIEKYISKISSVRDQLEENSKNVKVEVQTSIGAQLQLLHQREIQLFRQVDALISRQSCLLQLQLSGLYQHLGALRSTVQWVTQGGTVDLAKIGDLPIGSILTRQLHYKPTSQPHLEASIQSFGRVETQGESVSAWMLPEEEDYGDGDHHVLHKTLEPGFPSKIQMHFPKIGARLEDWLSVLKAKSGDSRDEDKKIFSANGDDEKWLRDTEGFFDLGDFEMAEVLSGSESIELLSHPDMRSNDMWLKPPPPPLPRDNNSLCNCLDMGNVEIENLDMLNCIPNKAPSCCKIDFSMSVPEISAVCRNNDSKCKTFNDCLCEDNCLVACLKEQMKDLKMQDNTKQDRINEVIRATTQKQGSPRDWLAQKKAKAVGDWLKLCARETGQVDIATAADDWLKVCSNTNPKCEKMVLKDWLEKNSESVHSSNANPKCEYTVPTEISKDRLKNKPSTEAVHCSNANPKCEEAVPIEISKDWLKNKLSSEAAHKFELPNHLIGFERALWLTDHGDFDSINSEASAKDSQRQSGTWLTSAVDTLVEGNVQTKAIKKMFAYYFQQQALCSWVQGYDNKVQTDWLASCM